MQDFIRKQPYLFAFGIFVADNLLAFPFVIAFNILGLELEPLRLIIPIVQSVFAVSVLYYLGWLRAAGFRKQIKNVYVLWFPLALAFVPVFMFGTIELSSYSILFFGFALIFTGISEEGIGRGIMLKALLPRGKWQAVLFMAFLFSAGHLTNLIFEDFTALDMIVKLLFTFSFGFLYGTVFLLTFNIWPLIVLHTVHDFSFLTSGTAGPYTTEPFPDAAHLALAALSIIFAVFMMRSVKTETILQESENSA